MAALRGVTADIHTRVVKANPARKDQPVAFIAGERKDKLCFGVIATGNPVVDEAIGGGWPRGGVSMCAGMEGTGKTMLAFDTIAHQIATNPAFTCIYVHLEAAAFPWGSAALAAHTHGLDPADMEARIFVIDAQSSAEKTFNYLLAMLWDAKTETPRDLVDLVVIDSVAAAAPEAEIKGVKEEGFEDERVGLQAKMMSKFMRDMNGAGMLGKRTALLLINQYRENMKPGGPTKVIPGGKAIGYYPKLVVEVKKRLITVGAYGKQDYKVLGHEVRGETTKNNTGNAWPQRAFMYPVRYDLGGVDFVVPIRDLAMEKGIIRPASGSYWFVPCVTDEGVVDEIKLNGKGAVEEFLRKSDASFELIKREIAAAKTQETAQRALEIEMESGEEDASGTPAIAQSED